MKVWTGQATIAQTAMGRPKTFRPVQSSNPNQVIIWRQTFRWTVAHLMENWHSNVPGFHFHLSSVNRFSDNQ